MPTRPRKRAARAGKPGPRGRARAAAPAARRTAPRRADYGASLDAYLSRLPADARERVDALGALVAEAAPDATASLRWGIPWFAVGGETFCAVAGFRSHANLILPGPPGTFADPGGLLEGEGKTGTHLKVRDLAELPRTAIRGWLRAAVRAARARAGS
jgi:hypothetical protein